MGYGEPPRQRGSNAQTDSTVITLRWGLSADQAEADALKVYAEACENTVVHYTPAP
ncbi:hypothetical protein [Streptomyces venezuelae]|uniref:hypothetical protein n=1 Tax=Streptomyces venezuelae TaxID=54571 RepID=UPI00278C4FB3|nr:hypothetical protein [Streptomyces venezuelae]